MTKGALLIARNNSQVNYIKQAEYAAARIKRHLNIPVSLITDLDYSSDTFDNIIVIEKSSDLNKKRYYDGIHKKYSLEFKNLSRSSAYDLTPYDETILIDTDYLIADSILKNCFDQSSNIMMYGSNAFEFSNWRNLTEFEYISDTSPKFYWATVVFFRKSIEAKTFFDLLKFIQDNWNYYKTLYQISSNTFRNDFSFSIAAHILSGQSNFVIKELPGTLYYTTDRDVLEKVNNDEFLFLIEKKNTGDYFPVKIKNKSIHVMNKFSLERVIDAT